MSNLWINYHHLFYFKTIAEEGSVSKAAVKLRLGQPTLSAQLKQLEETLEVKLFDRKHKKLILTEQGELAFDYAKSIFKMGFEMYEALHDRIKPNKLSLCIGAIDSVPKQIVLHMVKQALKFSPCQITLLEGRVEELLREVAAHKIDILVTNFLPLNMSARGIRRRSIARKPVAFFGAPKFKSLRKNFPYSISSQPLVLPTYDSKLRYGIDQWAMQHKIEIDIAVETQDIAVKKLLAVDGVGLIVASSYSVQRQVLGGELVELGRLEGIEEELLILSAERKVINPVAAYLMQKFKI
ncbi:MAG: LysR family transcriptional regulator [Bdellovibrionota bacterium]